MSMGAALKEQEGRTLLTIALAVLAAHAVFLLSLIFQPAYATPQIVTPRRVVVKTIALQPPQAKKAAPVPAAAAKPAATPKKAVQKEAPPKVVKKKVAKEAPKIKKEVAKAAPKTKKEEKPAPSQESISKIQESLSKINTKSLQDIPAIDIPDNLVALAVESLPDTGDANLPAAEAHYRDELARRLRAYLTLPERGEVVIRLTLDRTGNVVKLAIVSAANQTNKNYVERKVPESAFPGFGVYFGGEQQHTFTIALRSE